MKTKLSLSEVRTMLCYYDTRNPSGAVSYYSEEEIQEEGLTEKAKENCYCDNCFSGKTRLAEYIIENCIINEKE